MNTTTKKKSVKKVSTKKVAKKKTTKKIPKKVEAPQIEEQEVVHPEIVVKKFIGDKSMTRAEAQKILGWVMESENVKFKTDYLLKDAHGVKVRCLANGNNRPLYTANVMALKQEHLRKKWRFNGEPIIIGKYGQILNGQHSLISFVLACQEWDLHPGKWIDWQEEPTMEKLVVFGVDEDDAVVNTLDTCKPRTLTDVLFRSDVFENIPKSERKVVARVANYAINTLWSRMGAEYAFAPRQTHSEAMEFLNRHPKIMEAVDWMYREDSENAISRFLSTGYAAGMLYLMACSTTDPADYIRNPTEDSLDFKNWYDAEAFFILLSSGNEAMKPLRQVLGKMIRDDGGSRAERIALIAKAWTCWIEHKKIIPSKIELVYETENDVRTLAENPSVGGIDLIEFSPEEFRI